MSEGIEPLVALEKLEHPFKLDQVTLKLLRRDPVDTRQLELKGVPDTGSEFDSIYNKYVEDPQHGKLRVIDAEYIKTCLRPVEIQPQPIKQ